MKKILYLFLHEIPNHLWPPHVVLGLLWRPRAVEVVEGQAVAAVEDAVHDLDAVGARMSSHVVAPQSVAAVVPGSVPRVFARAVARPLSHEMLLSQIEETVLAAHTVRVGSGARVVVSTPWVGPGRAGPRDVSAEAPAVHGEAQGASAIAHLQCQHERLPRRRDVEAGPCLNVDGRRVACEVIERVPVQGRGRVEHMHYAAPVPSVQQNNLAHAGFD